MRVLIIGGGPGGLTTALALHRRKLPVAVYHAAPSSPPTRGAGGDGLWLPPNAMQIFERLGVADAIRRAGVTLDEATIQRVGGSALQRVDLAEAAEEFGALSVALSRAALLELLAERLPAPLLHDDMTCAGFSEKGDQVTARFENGTEVSGEVLVGADGATSGVRRRLVPSATLRETGQMSYGGAGSMRLPLGDAQAAREFWSEGARFGVLPVGDGTVHWQAVLPASEAPLRPRSPNPMKTALTDRFADFPPPVPALLRSTPPGGIERAELHDLAPMQQWHRGRVVLLGDAAHAATPTLGQGAAQAIEDAYALALTLDEHGTPEAAFSKYEELRMKKAHRVVRRSRQMGRLAHTQRGWARRLTGAALRLAPGALQRRELRRLFKLDF
jgi:2-polyprenyl-6-methoxyphenol hydroxylase-like FAD-dependent oxidoreductase